VVAARCGALFRRSQVRVVCHLGEQQISADQEAILYPSTTSWL